MSNKQYTLAQLVSRYNNYLSEIKNKNIKLTSLEITHLEVLKAKIEEMKSNNTSSRRNK